MRIEDIKLHGIYTKIGRGNQDFVKFKVLSKTKASDPCERIHIEIIKSGRIDYLNAGECRDWVRELTSDKIHNDTIVS